MRDALERERERADAEREGPRDGPQSAVPERVLWRFPLRTGDPRRTWGAGAPVDGGRPRAGRAPCGPLRVVFASTSFNIWSFGNNPMRCRLVTSLRALDGLQYEPGGRSVGLGFTQGDRRAPSTVATGDESPMNSHETHEVASSRPAPAMLGCAGTALYEYGWRYGEPGSARSVDRARGCPPHHFRPRVSSDSRRDQGLWLCVPL
jgi:hypothetical protein